MANAERTRPSPLPPYHQPYYPITPMEIHPWNLQYQPPTLLRLLPSKKDRYQLTLHVVSVVSDSLRRILQPDSAPLLSTTTMAVRNKPVSKRTLLKRKLELFFCLCTAKGGEPPPRTPPRPVRLSNKYVRTWLFGRPQIHSRHTQKNPRFGIGTPTLFIKLTTN